MGKQQQQQGKKGGQQQQGKKGGQQQQQQQQQQQGKKGGQQQDQQQDQSTEKFQAIVIGEFFTDAFDALTDTPLLMPIGTTAVRMIDHSLELLYTSNILDVTIACGYETAEKVESYLKGSPRWMNFLRSKDEGIKRDAHEQQDKVTPLEIKILKTTGKNVGGIIRDIHDSGIINSRNFVLVNKCY